jgi:hypothetical protein
MAIAGHCFYHSVHTARRRRTRNRAAERRCRNGAVPRHSRQPSPRVRRLRRKEASSDAALCARAHRASVSPTATSSTSTASSSASSAFAMVTPARRSCRGRRSSGSVARDAARQPDAVVLHLRRYGKSRSPCPHCSWPYFTEYTQRGTETHAVVLRQGMVVEWLHVNASVTCAPPPSERGRRVLHKNPRVTKSLRVKKTLFSKGNG